MKERLRIASLISGDGSTMEQIALACQNEAIRGVELACVIASKKSAAGIEKAKRLRVPVYVIDPGNFKKADGSRDHAAFGETILDVLTENEIDNVTQNGWMPLTPENVIKFYNGHIFNQHPGPVPEFGGKGMYGLRVHAAVLYFHNAAGTVNPTTEVIAQHVDPEFDKGAVVKSAKVEIKPNDTPETLQARALPIEHIVQIRLLQDLARGKLELVKRKTTYIRPGQERMLEEAKRKAIKNYPNG